jgi:hypothetical protein
MSPAAGHFAKPMVSSSPRQNSNLSSHRTEKYRCLCEMSSDIVLGSFGRFGPPSRQRVSLPTRSTESFGKQNACTLHTRHFATMRVANAGGQALPFVHGKPLVELCVFGQRHHDNGPASRGWLGELFSLWQVRRHQCRAENRYPISIILSRDS